MKRFLAIAIPVVFILTLTQGVGDRYSFGANLGAVKAIVTLQSAENQYDAQYGHWGGLKDLGSQGANLISGDLVLGRSAGYEFKIDLNAEGYQLSASPRSSECRQCPSFYSDQSMMIRTGSRTAPASSSSPILGDPIDPLYDHARVSSPVVTRPF